jgi:hypothetical protein
VTLVLDNGPDQTTKSQKNLTMLGRLWRDTGLDVLQVCHYAPGDSAQNPIEHQWAPRSRNLVGVFLKSRLEGEDKPPSEQSGMTSAMVTEKEVQVYDAAIDNLNSYWNGQMFDGFPVVSKAVPCQNADVIYNDADDVELFHKSGIRKVVAEMSSLHQEHKFLTKHMDRRTYYVSFSKCSDKTCDHCTSHPVRAANAVRYLRSAGGMFSPRPSLWCPDHFCTFLESETLAALGKTTKADEFCNTRVSQGVGRCDLCPTFIFMSKTEREKHNTMCHQVRKEKEKRSDVVPQSHVCRFTSEDGECGLCFPTRYRLVKHQNETGHKLKRGRPSKKEE